MCVRFLTCRTPSPPSSEQQIAADCSLLPGLLLGVSSSSFPLEVLMEAQECLPRKRHTLAQQRKKERMWKLRKDLRNGDKNSKKEKKKIVTRYYLSLKVMVKIKSCHVDGWDNENSTFPLWSSFKNLLTAVWLWENNHTNHKRKTICKISISDCKGTNF